MTTHIAVTNCRTVKVSHKNRAGSRVCVRFRTANGVKRSTVFSTTAMMLKAMNGPTSTEFCSSGW